MAVEDVERLTLNTRLVDEASGPLLKLKQTTSQTMNSMAADTAKSAGSMNQTVGGIAGAFSKAGSGIVAAAHVIGGGFATVGRGIESIATTAAKTAGVMGAALAAAGIKQATEVIRKGYERVITLQDATAQSAVLMGGDVAGAQKFIEGIRDVVTGTPFTLPDFAKAGTQLMMYGIEASKIPGILTAVGEASAGNGARAREVANQMTRAFSKMAATGKVQLDDIWSMADAGVPAIKILANGFGLTTAAMQDMISAGAVPADKAIQILTDGIINGTNGVAGATMAYAGSMEKLGQTWSGALAIMEAAKGKLGEAYLNPLKSEMPGILTAITGIYNSLQVFVPLWTDWLTKSEVLVKVHDFLVMIGTKIRELGANDSAGLKAIIDQFKEWAPLIAPIAGGLAGMASGFLGGLPIIGRLLPQISPLLGIVLGLIAASPELQGLFVGAFRTLTDLMGPLMPVFQGLAIIIGQVFNQVMGTLVDVVGQLLTAIVPLIPMFATLAAMLITSLAPILPPIITFLGNVAAILVGALVGALTVLLPPLIQFITMLIDMLAPILPVIFGALSQLLAIFMPLIPVIVQIAVAVLDLATQFIAQLLPPLIQLIPLFVQLAVIIGGAVASVLMAIMPLFLQLFQALMPLIPPIVDIIGLLVKLAIEVLTPLMPIITEVARIIVQVLTWAISNLSPIIRDVIDWIVKLVEKMTKVLQPILSTIGGMFKGIGDFIHDVVRGIGDFLKSGFDQVSNFIKFITGGSGGGIAKALGGGFVIRHMAEGGILGGYSPGHDSVPAILSPGEAVLVPELVRALGASNIMAANYAYSHGRPAMAGSPDRTGGSPSLGGSTQVTVIVSTGAIQISTTGGVDSGELRGALETVLADAARRAY